MATSVQCRLQERTLGMVMKEVEDDLAMFLEMRRSENDAHNTEELDQSLGSEVDFSLLSNGISTRPANQAPGDYFLNAENDKNDYDWLLSPPHTPSNPSPEVEELSVAVSKIMIDSSSTVQDCKVETDSSIVVPESKISIEQDLSQPVKSVEGPSKQINSTGQPAMSRSKNSSAGNGRPSSSGGKRATSTRSATPTGRPRSSTSKPSRASTPTSRATQPSAKPVASTARSSTPTRAAPRSSTPTSRPSNPAASKSASRSATPTRRTSAPSSIPIVSVARSSSLTKTGTTTLKKTAPSRGVSPTVKSRPLKPLETPNLTRDSSNSSKTLVPKRPASASRGRPAAPGARPSTTKSSSDGKPRRKSCSPPRGRATSATVLSNATALLSKTRGYEKDEVNPVLIGTQMVERVVNMRKLAPPKQDDNLSNDNPSKKSLSRENSGFGRSLSKKSLDMALRHMDIRRSVNGTLRPVLTRIPASSANGILSSSRKNKTGSVTDSPLATSSNTSSDPSVNNSSNNINWSEPEDNFGCERELSSPTIQQLQEQ